VCVISCDNVITIPLDALDEQPVGHLDELHALASTKHCATRSTSSTSQDLSRTI